MGRVFHSLVRRANLWIVLLLLAINGLTWVSSLQGGEPAYVAEPVLAPSLADLRARLVEGTHSGERFELRISDEEGAESIAWFLGNHPEIPFRYPRVEFHDGHLDAWGQAAVLGWRLSIHGVATMHLENGVPIARLTDLEVAGAPAPGFVLDAIQDALYQQIDLSNRQLPVVFETLELREGEMVGGGVIR